MPAAKPDHSFGCEKCCNDDAATAIQQTLDVTRRLVNDSHFIVALRACPDCRQPFLTIFTEFVDWKDGDDPQYRDIMPLTAGEVETLTDMGSAVDLAYVERIGRDRPRLCVNAPKGMPRQCFWTQGNLHIARDPG